MPQFVTRIIRIGNSKGIRIPKAVLEQCGLTDEVVLEPGKGRLTVRSARRRREGWDEAFRRMAESGDDALLDEDTGPLTRWDEDEWEWE